MTTATYFLTRFALRVTNGTSFGDADTYFLATGGTPDATGTVFTYEDGSSVRCTPERVTAA